MSPVTFKLIKVDFEPEGQRNLPELPYGRFVFVCDFEFEDEAGLDSWRISDVSFTDALMRNWVLLNEFEVIRSLHSFPDGIEFVFELDDLVDDAHCLVADSCFCITLASDYEAENQEFRISQRNGFSPLVWKFERVAANG